MKLAVKKDEGSVPGGGFHYMLHPMAMTSEFECESYRRMGYIIMEVPDEKAALLLAAATDALLHQIDVATLAEAALRSQEQDRGDS